MLDYVIIIPYRKRESHLKYFLENTAYLFEKNSKSKIIIVEQSEEKSFNRGKLINIGFHLYKDKSKYIITHDVDVNPKEKVIINNYNSDVPENEVYAILSPSLSLGCVVKIPNKLFLEINGFPNTIFGWGAEDRAIQNRLEHKRKKIKRAFKYDHGFKSQDNQNFKTFDNINDRDQKNYPKHHNIHYVKWKESHWGEKQKSIENDGLSNLDFKVLKKEMIHTNVELIKVEI